MRKTTSQHDTSTGGLRWKIAWILFLSTAHSYGRHSGRVAPVVSAELHLSHEDLSHIFGSFRSHTPGPGFWRRASGRDRHAAGLSLAVIMVARSRVR